MKTKERENFMGLVEMNESQKEDVKGGAKFDVSQSTLASCCGLIISTDYTSLFAKEAFSMRR